MRADRIRKLEQTLDGFYDRWDTIREETITNLGEKDALLIIDFHANNWLDIIGWINSNYDRKEQKNIVSFQFQGLFKEIYWLQFLFHNGNYPVIYRNLRYILELICQAYYVDTEYPNLSLDEQIEKTKETEEKVYGWNLVKSVLRKIFNSNESSIRLKFKPSWDYLNKHVHPSAKQMDIVAKEDFSSLVIDSFNEKLARNALRDTSEVFDIIDMIIFKKYPRIRDLALQYEFINEWEELLPLTIKFIRD